MKAVLLHQFGPPDVLRLENAPIPVPRPDEVLVRVLAAGVCSFDAQLRSGHHSLATSISLPAILGRDFSGIVENTGCDVSAFETGDEVFGHLEPLRGGAYAEFVCAKAAHLALKPRSLSHLQSAALPTAFLASWEALCEKGRLSPGQSVLILAHGGTAAVAVQLAKAMQATVYLASTQRDLKLPREREADLASDRLQETLNEVAQQVDLICDFTAATLAAYQTATTALTHPHGFSTPSHAPTPTLPRRALSVTVSQTRPNGHRLVQAASLVDGGLIKPPATLAFPLAQASQAHRFLETNPTREPLLLQIG